jgi:hypothetical protein
MFLNAKRNRICISFVSITAVTFSLAVFLAAAQQAPTKAPASSTPAGHLVAPASGVVTSTNPSDYREDFSQLTLKNSVFVPVAPVVGQVDDSPNFNFIRERWQVDWRPTDPIDLYIIKPKSVKNPPVILYLYSYPSDTDRFKTDDWAGTATANGFAAIGFVSAYTGHRKEFRTLDEAFMPKLDESLTSTVHDVQLILNFLTTRGDLDMTRVGMFGQGSGATVAILASTVDPRIKAVDVLNPWGDWPEFFAKSPAIAKDARARYVSAAFQAKVASLDPMNLLAKMKCQTFRMQDVRKSRPMPDDVQEHLEAAVPATGFVNKYGDSAALFPHASGGKLFFWIKSQLQPDTNSQVAVDKSERVHFYPGLANNDPLGLKHN